MSKRPAWTSTSTAVDGATSQRDEPQGDCGVVWFLGRPISSHDGSGWMVLQDRAGNRFCIVRSDAERSAEAADLPD